MRKDDLIHEETRFRLEALMSSSDVPDGRALEEEYSSLIRSVTAFDRNETLALVSGLLTLPQFHANTIRMELLQIIVHRNAVGRNKPTRNRVSEWLNQGMGQGWASQKEDPVEDVFISNVTSSSGNSRIFEGTWEGNDFWLQGSLNVLNTLCGELWANGALKHCRAILDLSDALAGRCGLTRYQMGGGLVRSRLELPPQQMLYDRAALVRFSRRDLDDLGLSLVCCVGILYTK